MTQSTQIPTGSIRQIIWLNVIFFTVTTSAALIGAPLYIYHHGLSWQEMVLFIFYVAVTGLSITVGYHRLFAHQTFKSTPIVDFLVLFFGAAAFEQSALDWSSQHRDHHRFVDTDQDPYSIKKGFFYAHIGWLIFWKHTINYDNAKDLKKNAMLMHQSQHYLLWSVVSGILLPVMIGALSGHALGAFILSVCLRLTLVYHSTFCINSVCHMFGKATYDIYATAKDHWFVAFLTNGEGYHNFHHRFPTDYRNGVRWYQWDPSKWTIAVLEKMGLAKDLKRVSKFTILQAKLAAENRSVEDKLLSAKIRHELEIVREKLKIRYEQLLDSLSHWEAVSKKNRSILFSKAAQDTAALRDLASKEIREAKNQFRRARGEWKQFVKTDHFNPETLAA